MRNANWGIVLSAAFMLAACDKGADSTPTPEATATTMAAPAPSAPSTAAAAAAAASAAEATAAAADAAEGEKASTNLRGYHRHHHHGGVAMFVHMAIDTLGVAPEKKAQLEKLQTELHTKMAPTRDSGRTVLSLIADGVAAGTLDNAKINAALAKQEAAANASNAVSADVMNQLHDLLSPAERAALVDKVKSHAEVWKKVSHGEEHGSKDKGGQLATLATDLSLTPEQVDQISAALAKDAPPKADSAALDAHLQAFETAFLADKFDAKTLTTANAANVHISKYGTARLVRFYKVVTPLLTPEQRTKLAEHLRERSNDPHSAK